MNQRTAKRLKKYSEKYDQVSYRRLKSAYIRSNVAQKTKMNTILDTELK